MHRRQNLSTVAQHTSTNPFSIDDDPFYDNYDVTLIWWKGECHHLLVRSNHMNIDASKRLTIPCKIAPYIVCINWFSHNHKFWANKINYCLGWKTYWSAQLSSHPTRLYKTSNINALYLKWPRSFFMMTPWNTVNVIVPLAMEITVINTKVKRKVKLALPYVYVLMMFIRNLRRCLFFV